MSYGVRPFFHRLGVALRGPDDPAVAKRRERAGRVIELQRVINKAGEYDSLTRNPAWARIQAEWAVRLKELMGRLRTGGAKDFEANQAALDAYEEATNIIPNALAQAELAREELETLVEE